MYRPEPTKMIKQNGMGFLSICKKIANLTPIKVKPMPKKISAKIMTISAVALMKEEELS